jgi:hypothetical protein
VSEAWRPRSGRLRPASGCAPGPASRRRLTSLPSRGPARAAPTCGVRSGSRRPSPLPGALCSRHGGPGPLPSLRDPHFDPAACLPPAAFTCSWSGRRASRPGPRRRERVSERHGSAALSRRRHCALGAAPLGAGLASSCGRGGRAASARAGATLPLSVRPGKSSLTGAAAKERERERGRAAGRVGRGLAESAMAATSPGGPPPSASPAPRPLVRPRAPPGQGAWSRPVGPARGPRATSPSPRTHPPGLPESVQGPRHPRCGSRGRGEERAPPRQGRAAERGARDPGQNKPLGEPQLLGALGPL